ncbi:MAG: type II secretion system protein, partial [Planctomycetes bacterium]|nr:type II secretion system protein [Planctomycetota bacterium]
MKKKAFTLIELLVVIAIIAVLMGILMPALQRVREQAKRRSCAARVRQHALAIIMYADDNSNKLPM